ncbi:MAG: SpvB/TcaC N-terminal domain-containing protein [Luteolibacter sp.]
MKSDFPKILLAVFLNVAVFVHPIQAELSLIDFESVEWVPWEPVDSHSQSGWQRFAGSAVVSPPGEGYGGGQALLLEAGGNQEAFVSKEIEWDAQEEIAFIDFQVKPSADPEGNMATVFSNGTQLAFQVPESSDTGYIWVYHGNDGAGDPNAEPEQWIQTIGSFQVAPGGDEALDYLRVTLRHDYQRNLWDLFVDGKLAAANLSFGGRGNLLTGIDFHGSLVGDTRIDDLSALATNMLFPDADKDGLPDAWEIANGSDPNRYDRDEIKPGTNRSFLDLYMESLWNGNGGVNTHQGIPSSGSIPPLTILGSHQPVGALKGSLAVGPDGTAGYSIPIDIPKGTAGMEPKIALAYSSNGGNGVAGLGWSLTGFQRITRGPSLASKDGDFQSINFTGSDRFSLDGERLVCVSGTYGADGSEYRTEVDSFARITAIGNGPDSWKVETKAGLTVYLGTTPDSKTQVAQGTLSWGVNRVEDSVGNYYTVEYARDAQNGAPFDFINDRVAAVHYTGNFSRNQSPYCHVYFDYESRPDSSRAYSTFAGYQASKRLSKIRVMTDGAINHSYRLEYSTSYQTGRSLLASVTKMMRDEPSLAVPPTVFRYDGLQEGEDFWVESPSYASGLSNFQFSDSNGNYLGSVIIDLDGNNLSDIVEWKVNSYGFTNTGDPKANVTGKVYKNDGNSFVEDVSLALPIAAPLSDATNGSYYMRHSLLAQPLDIDKNGQIDIMSISNHRHFVSHGSPVPGGSMDPSFEIKNEYQCIFRSDDSWVTRSEYELPFRYCHVVSKRPDGPGRHHHFEWIDLNSDGFIDLSVHTSQYGYMMDKVSGSLILGVNSSISYLNRGNEGPGWIRDAISNYRRSYLNFKLLKLPRKI